MPLNVPMTTDIDGLSMDYKDIDIVPDGDIQSFDRLVHQIQLFRQANATAKRFRLKLVAEGDLASTSLSATCQVHSVKHIENLNIFMVDCLDVVLDFLPVDQVIKVGHTSRAMRDRAQGYLRRSANAMLGRWLRDPEEFRSRLPVWNAVISGSNILRFAIPAPWKSNDLDIYVGGGADHATEVIKYLTHEGYKVITEYHATPVYPDVPFASVTHLAKVEDSHPDRPTPPPQHIDLIESSTASPLDPITNFHCTSVMNYMTDERLVMLYPKLTLQKKGIIHGVHHHNNDPKFSAAIQKYRMRGYEISHFMDGFGMECGDACPTLWRTTGDVACLVASIAGDVIFPNDGLEHTWTLSDSGFAPAAICPSWLCSAGVMLKRRDQMAPVVPIVED